MNSRTWVAAALLGVATSARADLDADARKWLDQCVDALTSKNAKVRDGAETAIAKLGIDAVPEIVADSAHLKTDADWTALAAALRAMGAKAADAVEDRREAWPTDAVDRLTALVERLRKPAAEDAPADESVDDRVRRLLEKFRDVHSYSSADPNVFRVVGIGRPAVPTLLAMLRETQPHEGMLDQAVTDALAALVTDEDLPELAKLLDEGRLVAARAFRKLRSAAALDALLAPVKRGFVDYELVSALGAYGKDPRVGAALVEWLEKSANASEYEVAPVADFLGSRRVAAAVPALLKFLPTSGDFPGRAKVAIALERLGRKEGIEAMVKETENSEETGFGGEPRDGWARHEAAQELNKVVGEAIYRGSFEPGRGLRGNMEDAAKKFREWWDASKDKLRFDEKRLAWVVD